MMLKEFIAPMASVLSSWKEVARYLGKGIRTVQRWESELGMPIHRPDRGNKQIIFAFTQELDEWIRRRMISCAGANGNEYERLAHLLKELRHNCRQLHMQVAEARQNRMQLRETLLAARGTRQAIARIREDFKVAQDLPHSDISDPSEPSSTAARLSRCG